MPVNLFLVVVIVMDPDLEPALADKTIRQGCPAEGSSCSGTARMMIEAEGCRAMVAL